VGGMTGRSINSPDPARKPIDATLSRTDVRVERRGNGLSPLLVPPADATNCA
jgi:hypothetical protein